MNVEVITAIGQWIIAPICAAAVVAYIMYLAAKY